MPSVAETQELVNDIVRLRRAEQVPEAMADVVAVRARLESRLGPTLSRSRTGRVLGVSQTAIDRWVRAGQIPTVMTPSGRHVVPRRFVVEMAELIERLREQGTHRRVLAAALRHQEASADDVRKRLGSSRRRSPGPRGHRTAEQRSLVYHEIVAERLTEQLVVEARQRVETLAAHGVMHLRYAEQWQEILARPLEEIARQITRDDQAARDLRQNTPFAGVLNEHERRQIIEAIG